jgi:phospholipid/cholesterol/gamma-HCH transport system substrate-binding protein
MTRVLSKYFVFVVSMLLVLSLLILVLGKIQLESQQRYAAEFDVVSGLKSGEVVRLAGVDVGRVRSVDVDGRAARVEFDVNSAIRLTDDATLQVRYENLLGDRYLNVTNGKHSATPLPAGGTIGAANTAPALDLDALLGGLAPLSRSLQPEQVNRLSGELLSVLQGQGGTITGILQQIAALTSSLADRDALIGSTVTNLNTVLATVSDDSERFSTVLDQLQHLTTGLAEQKTPITDALEHIDQGAATVTDLLTDDRPAIQNDIAQLNRTATVLDDGSAQIEAVLSELPKAYQRLSRLGAYGSFFNFYLCAVTVKVDGPGGDPIITKLVQQKTGRCVTPQ